MTNITFGSSFNLPYKNIKAWVEHHHGGRQNMLSELNLFIER
jgi:hypothetical protein